MRKRSATRGCCAVARRTIARSRFSFSGTRTALQWAPKFTPAMLLVPRRRRRRRRGKNLNAWWSLIRASIYQRQNARRGTDKYKVATVARPPMHITTECVLQRLRAPVAEEALRVPEKHVLLDGACSVPGSLATCTTNTLF